MTTAIVSRANDSEAPYIKGFIEHYLKMGASHFYICIPAGQPRSYLKNAIEPYLNYITLCEPDHIMHIDMVQNEVLKVAKEDYLLNIDIDEFLDVPSLNQLPDADILYFKWINISLAEFDFSFLNGRTSQTLGVNSQTKKYRVRRSKIKTMECHRPILSSETSDILESTYPIYHYYCRSHSDLILKEVHREVNASSQQQVNSIRNALGDPLQFPKRTFQTLLVSYSCQTHGTPRPNYCQENSTITHQILNQYFSDQEISKLTNNIYQLGQPYSKSALEQLSDAVARHRIMDPYLHPTLIKLVHCSSPMTIFFHITVATLLVFIKRSQGYLNRKWAPHKIWNTPQHLIQHSPNNKT